MKTADVEIAHLSDRKRVIPAVEVAYKAPQNYLDNQFVYVLVSPRARGLSVGVNVNPDKHCNFDCVYCEVNRDLNPRVREVDVDRVAQELHRTLELVYSRRLRSQAPYADLPDELLNLRHVVLSGEGEPTLCPHFAEVVQTVMHARALGAFPFFKVVLISNATGLDLPQVHHGLRFFTRSDELWLKLDAGTAAYMEKVNRPQVPMAKVLENILHIGRQRPVVIQSLFASIHGEEPADDEIEEYARRLEELKAAGAQISLVQIYSATRPTHRSECRHLPLKTLSHIAQVVRKATGLQVEVF